MSALECIRDMLYDELDDVAEKKQLDKNTLEIIDKLTHSLKSVETILSMNEYNDGYARRNYNSGMNKRYYDSGYAYGGRSGSGRSNGGSYRSGGIMGGSRNGGGYRYSRDDGKMKAIETLHMVMEDSSSEQMKDAIRRVIEQMEDDD